MLLTGCPTHPHPSADSKMLLTGCTHPCQPCADSKMLLTGCDDMHVNMYDVENGALIESFSGKECNAHIHESCTP